MHEMAETNRLIEGGVRSTYKTLTNTQSQGSMKIPMNPKSIKKMDKTVKFANNKGKEMKEISKSTKKKDDANTSRKDACTNLTLIQ